MAKPLIYSGLCTTDGCPWPSSNEYHQPFCQHWTNGKPLGQHHHVVKRSQGGESGEQVFLCPACHTAVDERRFEDGIVDGMYTLTDKETGEVLAEVRVSGDWVKDPEMRFVRRQVVESTTSGTFLVSGSFEYDTLPAVIPEDYERAAVSLGIPGTITEVSWTPDADMSMERWAEIGHVFGRMQRSSGFWIGDWMNAGEDRFGEAYAQVIDELGLAEQTLANYASVCRKLPASVRHPELTFSHHAAVSALPAQAAQEWLGRAEEEQWSVSALNAAVRPLSPAQECEEHQFALRCLRCGKAEEG